MFSCNLISHRLFVRRRTSRAILCLAVFFVAISCLLFLLQGAHSGYSPSSAQKKSHNAESGRVLSLEERVAYQRAIDEVYWRHSAWPKTNERPAPSFYEVVPVSETLAKVEDVLRKSSVLEQRWGKQFSDELLQAEIDRIARDTRKPEVLRELWTALDNDPFLIAEMLARPLLADRLIRDSFAYDKEFTGKCMNMLSSN